MAPTLLYARPHMFSDLRFALRALLNAPGFTAAAILILALGIGANTSVFSVIEAVVLRPLPYDRPGELYSLESPGANQVGLFNPFEFRAYRDRTHAFSGLSAAVAFNTTWVDRGQAQLVQGLRVSANLFDLLGMRPLAGRLLSAADGRPDAVKAVVISEAMWRTVYGASPDVVGRSITVDGEPRTVVGVVPNGFILPLNSFHADVCVPLQVDLLPTRDNPATLHYMRVFGRLGAGVTLAQANADLRAIAEELRLKYPADFSMAEGAQMKPLASDIVGDTAGVLTTLSGVVASLLLLACANLAGLLLVRALGRQREFAIRSALGCSRAQLMRLLIAEALVLAVAGGIAGLLLAQWNLGALLALLPAGVPRAHDVHFDGHVLAFTAGVSLLAGLLPGLAPLWLCSRMDLREATGGRGTTAGGAQMRVRHMLAAAQVALALALLACTALFVRSFWIIGTQHPGADPRHIVTARLTLPAADYPDAKALVRYSEQLEPRLRAIPGVEHVGSTSLLPLASGLATAEFAIAGHAPVDLARLPSANYRLVTPGFFDALGVPLQRGRRFTERDDAAHPLVVIVSAALARAYFPDGRVLGRQLEINDQTDGMRTFEIVGVAADMKQSKMEDAPSYDVYVPFRQMSAVAVPWVRLRNFWVVRAAGAPAPIEAAMRTEVRAVDPSVPVASMATMEEVVDSALAVRRFTLIVVAFLAGAALLLTAAGVYATIAYGVTQRTREIGVRLALGATAQQIFRLIVREGMMLTGSGAVLGLGVAFALAHLITSQLYGVSPRDPWALASSVLVLMLIAIVACAVPARRAAQVNPLEAMRHE